MPSEPVRLRSVATASMGGALPRQLEAAAQAGFDAIELRERDLLTCSRSPEAVSRLARSLGIGVDAYQPFRVRPEEPEPALVRRAAAKLDVAASLGAGTLVVHVPGADAPGTTDTLLRLSDEARARDLRLAVRPASVADAGWSTLAGLVSGSRHPGLTLCLTSEGWPHAGPDLDALTAADVGHVQLSGVPLFSLPDQGPVAAEASLVHLVAAVVRLGWTGALTMESVNDLDEARGPARGAADAMRLLLSLEDEARSLLADEGADRARLSRLAAVPVAPEPTRYAFAELAADEGGTGLAESALRGLGFTLQGRHRSKPVRLWAQGQARVLVTTDRGVRHARADVGVAALGIETTDPAAASRRALHLRAYPHHRRRESAEADLPLFESPDGSDLLFCAPSERPGSWLDDFDPVAEPAGPTPGTGVHGIDHVALTVDRDRFDEAVLFFRSVVGLTAEELVQLPWSSRATRSRALCTGARGLRLVLNARRPRGEDGEAPAPEHVAFACDDVVAAARQLRARPGGFYLPVPDNYYDDLAVSSGLAPEQVETLREAGVLYDRDDTGEFLHVFTPLVGDRLFLELVQRVDGYDGYGAPNTPIRTAAHRGAS